MQNGNLFIMTRTLLQTQIVVRVRVWTEMQPSLRLLEVAIVLFVLSGFRFFIWMAATRQFALQDASDPFSEALVSIDLHDGCAIAVGRDANIAFRHGILQGVREETASATRVSVVLNGWIDQDEEKLNKL
jgi:hypothetical protein